MKRLAFTENRRNSCGCCRHYGIPAIKSPQHLDKSPQQKSLSCASHPREEDISTLSTQVEHELLLRVEVAHVHVVCGWRHQNDFRSLFISRVLSQVVPPLPLLPALAPRGRNLTHAAITVVTKLSTTELMDRTMFSCMRKADASEVSFHSSHDQVVFDNLALSRCHPPLAQFVRVGTGIKNHTFIVVIGCPTSPANFLHPRFLLLHPAQFPFSKFSLQSFSSTFSLAVAIGGRSWFLFMLTTTPI
mmetsp:Transcript_17995/g.59089  ORF Transcript_17995/g.59089 Transcript_17995/m.59089 type:complete len:245 (-) Transcript_17995:209-943(-)